MPWIRSAPVTLEQLHNARSRWENEDIKLLPTTSAGRELLKMKTDYEKRIMDLENIIHNHANPSRSLLERVSNLENFINDSFVEPKIKEGAVGMYSGGSTRRKSKIKEPIKSKNKQKKLRKTKRLK